MRRPVLIALGSALLLAGCGGGKVVAPAPETVQGSLPASTTETQPPSQTPKGDPTAGKAVFQSAGCVGCHTLKAANATGTVGPNLDEAKPPLSRIVDRVTNGKGVMPSFKDQLSDKQIADVAAFVYQSTHGS
jgi:mono/diheme cytochrome c family protein